MHWFANSFFFCQGWKVNKMTQKYLIWRFDEIIVYHSIVKSSSNWKSCLSFCFFVVGLWSQDYYLKLLLPFLIFCFGYRKQILVFHISWKFNFYFRAFVPLKSSPNQFDYLGNQLERYSRKCNVTAFINLLFVFSDFSDYPLVWKSNSNI